MGLLDRNRSFGVICGPHFAKYEQDGKFYDVEGKEVREFAEVEEPSTLVEEFGEELSIAIEPTSKPEPDGKPEWARLPATEPKVRKVRVGGRRKKVQPES